MSWLSRLANLFRTDRLTRDIDDELAAHLDEAAAQGRAPAAARRALGPSLRLREESRDIRLIPWLDGLRADVVFAWRQLNKRRITSLAAVLSLGMAIGSCTTAFRIVDALFLRPLPVSHPDQLYLLTFHGATVNGQLSIGDLCNYPLFRQIAAAVAGDADSLAISGSGPSSVTFGSEQDLERANVEYVSGRMFAAFGLRPAAGRLLSEDDDAPGRAYAVLSFDYWKRRFGGDPKVIGRTLHYGRDLYTIVGVAPKDFTGIQPGTMNDIFVPAMMNPYAGSPQAYWFRALLVLKQDVTPERVIAPIQAVAHAFFEEQVKTVSGMPKAVHDAVVNKKVVLDSARSGVGGMQNDFREPLIALSVLVALVLLIACANVANLMTAQAAARAREMALRVSIGAGRSRLIQLVLVESALLAAFAAAVGGLFAMWSAPFVVARINPPDRAAQLILPADWRVLGFAFALALVVMLLYGLAPSLRAARTDPAHALKGGAPKGRGSGLMNALIAAQVAFCFLVLFVAGLFVATLQRLSHQPLGFSPDRVLALDIRAQGAQTPAVWNRLLQSLQSRPGVAEAASAEFPLLSGTLWNNQVTVNGHFSGDFSHFMSVSPGWFETMKIRLLAGRDFRPDETFPGQTAIVDQTFADFFFKGEDVLGKSFETRIGPASTRAQFTIVGLAANARYANLRETLLPVIYVPPRSEPTPETTAVLRTVSPNPLALVPALREAISSAMPGLRLSGVHTQQEYIDNQTIRERLLAMLASFFAGVALLLAAVGLYGVLDYSVFQRRREIGIRMAVGARASHIVRGVTLGVIAWVLAGSTAGLALGLASTRFIESLLYQVKATDVSSLASPALALLTAALLAALPPVLRAIRIDPVQTLRSE